VTLLKMTRVVSSVQIEMKTDKKNRKKDNFI